MAALSATSTDQPYVYADLNLERPAFRLARLLNGDGPEMKCELFQAYLDERESVLPYEAVSYTWGPTDLCHSVDVNGKRLAITASLYVALQHLRYAERDRILWVDGICINQDNHKERGHQVQQMGHIYRHAERVIFWLGLATNETDKVMESLQLLTKHSMRQTTSSWRLRDRRWHHMWNTCQWVSLRLDPDFKSTLQQGLTNLLTRTWFRRAWILQEVANAQSALICCGQKSASARLFPLMPILLGVTPKELQQAVLDIMPGPSRKATWWAQDRSLYCLLRYFGSSEATEPRDIIYALRGISTDANDPSILTPDYGLSEQELLQQVSQFLFYCDVNKNGVLVRDVRDLAGRVSHFNSVVIGKFISSFKKEELSVLLKRGNIHISNYTVRSVLEDRENGLYLLQHGLEGSEFPLVLGDDAVFAFARWGDANIMSMVLRHWVPGDISIRKRFLLSAALNEAHAPQILRVGMNGVDLRFDNESSSRSAYFEKELWLATLLNNRTGFEAREEIFRASSFSNWKYSADVVLWYLKSPSQAFSLITSHPDVSEFLPSDVVPFTDETVASFKLQLQLHGWSPFAYHD
ncbi:HET-domain-containing protein [Colletotrichum sojae]|uniref:HET-domain-containing protein n=1 Tax=Colletotrichum sojae TaxID=2175907 RepID=A0A8H6MUC1_9PEZI|nr:HET-domain-containing protein [Colletotrichum sojae]